ncbi:MAG: hypothetical protein AB4041_21840 [Microcystaceae cyanobacterium]
MKHSIQPYTPDKIYQILVGASFSITAKSEAEAKEKLAALLSEIDVDHWEIERICESEN